jgi:hypothetical protein
MLRSATEGLKFGVNNWMSEINKLVDELINERISQLLYLQGNELLDI